MAKDYRSEMSEQAQAAMDGEALPSGEDKDNYAEILLKEVMSPENLRGMVLTSIRNHLGKRLMMDAQRIVQEVIEIAINETQIEIETMVEQAKEDGIHPALKGYQVLINYAITNMREEHERRERQAAADKQK